MPETAGEISKRSEVRRELERTAGDKKPREKVKARGTDKFWFVTHALLLISFAVLYLLLGSKLIPIAIPHLDLARRVLRGATLIVILLVLAKAISVYAIGRIEDASTRFTLKRIEHLIVAFAIAVIAGSMIFVNWYAALTALGVGSIIVGLAVQTPMKSFIAWIYIWCGAPIKSVIASKSATLPAM